MSTQPESAAATVVKLPPSSPAYSAGTAPKKIRSIMGSFLGKPYNWALMTWGIIFFLQVMGAGIPLWVLYLCAIPFCISIMLAHFQNYKENRKTSPNIGFNTLSNISPVFFLIIQLVLLIYMFVSKQHLIDTSSKIPENFIKFKRLINFFLIGQMFLIMHYLRHPADIKNLSLWSIMSITITFSLACMHYMWIVLTKLITDG